MSTRSWRPRFGLGSLLALVAFGTMATAYHALSDALENSRELEDAARVQLEQSAERIQTLELELGIMQIVDPKKLQFLRLRTREPRTWRWRVYLPEGVKLKLHSFLGELPRQSSTSAPSSGSLSSSSLVRGTGEQFTIEFFACKSAKAEWTMSLVQVTRRGESGSTQSAPHDLLAWLNSGSSSTSDVPWTAPLVVDTDERVELLRVQEMRQGGSPEEGRRKGVLIWIDDGSGS